MSNGAMLARITAYYLESGDFNGFPVRDFGLRADETKAALAGLVSSANVSLNFGDRHPNPYIQAFPPEEEVTQLEKLEATQDLTHVCAYPTAAHLHGVVDPALFEGRPFTLLLARGRPQLEAAFFDLAILEEYRNDPRYRYTTTDVGGHISYQDEQLPDQDQILLETFGFGLDHELNRYVGAYLRYLSALTPEHQQRWQSRRVEDELFLHPDYVRSSMGEWHERPSIYEAFLEEQHFINDMAALMGRPPFWRQEFRGDARPRGFGFLLRPTLNEFNAFVHTLDRMCSDNINIAFFDDDVELEEEVRRRDGRIEVRRKGSIQVLDEWLNRVRFPDPEPRHAMIEAFRRIRNLRNRPAHALRPDEFDQQYTQRQRRLMIDAYGSIRTLRLILANHPAARAYEVPEWFAGDPWTF